MTTIITRVFAEESAAQNAADRLEFKGVPSRAIDVIAGPDDAASRMERAMVHPSAIDKYGAALAAGQAVLVVRATYKPLGAAQLTRDVLDGRETVAVAGVEDDYFVPNMPDKAGSILKDHPRFLTMPPELDAMIPRGRITEAVMPMTIKHRSKRSATAGGYASRKFWPMPLLSTKPRKNSVIHGGRFVSRSVWPMPLLSDKPRSKSVIRGGGFPLSRLLGWPTVT